ncbi:hypothetical protein DHEL01_v204136 [Diaporthe helianthi]|uniref:FAD/NAD(P)-binding domain-containing protein n=1 Tax=Diaporthe helianthi TaxID=158607 RepID=A0A2P5I4R3_DIAHE|nr:hypothetical protein DHEL01_v204136 [Diaporthe helianthi]
MAKSPKNIVILGGSYGGLSVAHYTLKHVIPKAADKETFRIILISTSSQAFCRPSCPRAMLSDDMFPQDKLFVDIEAQFQHYENSINFQFIKGTVVHLDHKQRVVVIKKAPDTSQELAFHALVIATGASTPSPLLGFIQDDSFLRESWSAFRKALPAAQNIVISGGGPTSVETAGELGQFLNGRPRFFRSRQTSPRVNITIITSSSKILPDLRQSIADKAEKLSAGVGVSVIKNARVKSVIPAGARSSLELLTSKTTVVLDDGRAIDADIYIPATGTTPNTGFISDRSLLAPDGRVNTNPSTLRVDCAGPCYRMIYAIGDASSYARPAVHNILSAVPVLCASMRHDLLFGGSHQEDPAARGTSKGVGAAMGTRLPGFLVWLLKGRDYWLWTTESLWNGKKWNKES